MMEIKLESDKNVIENVLEISEKMDVRFQKIEFDIPEKI